jgi:hypothetical protein
MSLVVNIKNAVDENFPRDRLIYSGSGTQRFVEWGDRLPGACHAIRVCLITTKPERGKGPKLDPGTLLTGRTGPSENLHHLQCEHSKLPKATTPQLADLVLINRTPRPAKVFALRVMVDLAVFEPASTRFFLRADLPHSRLVQIGWAEITPPMIRRSPDYGTLARLLADLSTIVPEGSDGPRSTPPIFPGSHGAAGFCGDTA